jgi:type I site-specific restriction endonuclease
MISFGTRCPHAPDRPFYILDSLRELLSHDLNRDRYYQPKAIAALENANRDDKRRITMSVVTDTGKTRMIISVIYRLMKSRHTKRVWSLSRIAEQVGTTSDRPKTYSRSAE